MRNNWVLAPSHTDRPHPNGCTIETPFSSRFYPPGCINAATKGEKHHGELLLNGSEFVLVALLGFMPLMVVHYADQRPQVRLPRRTLRSVVAAKAAVLVGVTNWLIAVVW